MSARNVFAENGPTECCTGANAIRCQPRQIITIRRTLNVPRGVYLADARQFDGFRRGDCAAGILSTLAGYLAKRTAHSEHVRDGAVSCFPLATRCLVRAEVSRGDYGGPLRGCPAFSQAFRAILPPRLGNIRISGGPALRPI